MNHNGQSALLGKFELRPQQIFLDLLQGRVVFSLAVIVQARFTDGHDFRFAGEACEFLHVAQRHIRNATWMQTDGGVHTLELARDVERLPRVFQIRRDADDFPNTGVARTVNHTGQVGCKIGVGEMRVSVAEHRACKDFGACLSLWPREAREQFAATET